MVQRKDIPVKDDYTIAVVTEQMADGQWAVVASIKHRSPSGEQSTDLPVDDRRYATSAKPRKPGIAKAAPGSPRTSPTRRERRAGARGWEGSAAVPRETTGCA